MKWITVQGRPSTGTYSYKYAINVDAIQCVTRATAPDGREFCSITYGPGEDCCISTMESYDEVMQAIYHAGE